MTRDELVEAVADALWRDNTLSGSSYDQGAKVAIRVVLEAALDAVDGDDGYPGECYDEAHVAIDKRIRALMPETTQRKEN